MKPDLQTRTQDRGLRQNATSQHPGRNLDPLEHLNWRALRYLNLYRLGLSLVFAALYLAGTPSILGSHNETVYRASAIFYLIFSIYSIFSIQRKTINFNIQIRIQVLIDIIVLTLLMHSSGGLTSGLGILIAIAIAGGSIIMAGKTAILFASIASMAVLGEQVFAHLNNSFETTAYTQAGTLGATFFATALLAHVLANRVRESEALARQRGIDLANMEQVNEYIIQNMGAGIIVIDKENHLRLVNDTAWQLLGMPALKENQFLVEVSPELDGQLKKWKSDPETELKPFRSHPNSADILARFKPLGKATEGGTLVILEDSTEVTQQLQQMKLASLGRLTASIAHEIRNPLGAISHAAQLLEESPVMNKSDHRLTEIIRDHSRRMNTIVENILQLSRREPSRPRNIELKSWLGDFLTEFCSMEKIDPASISLDIFPEDTQIQIDTGHFQQIMWNLCKNALKYGDNPEQKIKLSLRGGVTEESRSPFLDIIDYGKGIDPENVQQIFEPFFTTGTGGTGLGLYITRELCECNKARLSYHPVPTGGSCFRISFHNPTGLKL